MPRRPTLKLPPLNLGEETIGQRIARIRKQKGYTQTELAQKMGTIQSLISDYETGRLRLYDEMVVRFAVALDVSTDEILGLKRNNHKPTKPSLKIMRRLNKIDSLPESQQKTLLKTIDVFLKGAGK